LSQGRYQLLRKDDAGKGRSQQGLELDVFDQESGNIRSTSMFRSHSHAGKCSATSKYSAIHGISQGKEQSHDI